MFAVLKEVCSTRWNCSFYQVLAFRRIGKTESGRSGVYRHVQAGGGRGTLGRVCIPSIYVLTYYRGRKRSARCRVFFAARAADERRLRQLGGSNVCFVMVMLYVVGPAITRTGGFALQPTVAIPYEHLQCSSSLPSFSF